MAASIPLASGASLPLPPGFKFKPTDEEIVVRYLCCRAVNQPLPSTVITDKDILSHSPWELVPAAEGASEKYFFHHRVVKWDTSTRWKRGTKDGFWKPSGKEVPIFCSGVRGRIPLLVGTKRTQVFYLGKAPSGQRTDWVMEEYRLAGAGLGPYRMVLCSTNQNLGQRNCIRDVIVKKPDGPADTALHGTDPNMGNIPMFLYPDVSWVVCRIHKKRKCTTDVLMGSSKPCEEKMSFIDFLGQGNYEKGTASSNILVEPRGEIETSEVDGHAGSTEIASTSNGN